MDYYAGIGSRKTPDYVLELMERLAWRLFRHDFILRSGHAPGADQAFERGARGRAEIFLPYKGFQHSVPFVNTSQEPEVQPKPTIDAIIASEKLHPDLPLKYRPYYARNLHILCGMRPLAALYRRGATVRTSKFVLCWADNPSSGTGSTMLTADRYLHIPVWNLADPKVYESAFDWAWEKT